jgi:5-methylcytosine-specific restriction endonuclease McrA
MSEEAPTHKQCTKCEEMKLLEEFERNKYGKYGRRDKCKVCFKEVHGEKIRARAKAYYRDHMEKVRSYARVYYNNPDVRAKIHARYLTNAEAKRIYNREYRAANAETIREQKRDYELANRDKIRERHLAYRTLHNDKISIYRKTPHARAVRHAHYAANRDAYRASKHQRRARKKGNGGDFSTAELKAMRIEYAGVCFYCKGQHEPDDLTIDHVIPIDQGGRHEAANIVLACGICNSSKGNRTPDQWTDRWYERKNRPKKK